MGALIKAEFRKILSTKLWWGLLIAAVVLGFGWSFGAGKLIASIGERISNDAVFSQTHISLKQLAFGVFALSRGINITTIIPALFGALGLSSELHRRTITTSFLTAPTRSALLGAKAVTYVIWSVLYGVVIVAMAAAGTVAGTGGAYLPDTGGLLLICLAGVISCVLWALLGLGLGALLGSTTGSVVLVIIYGIVAEPIVDLMLHNHVVGFLPNGSADGLTGATAGQILVNQMQGFTNAPLVQIVGQQTWNDFLDGVRIAAGAIGSFDWWVSGLIFFGWAMVFFLAGLLVNQKRDIT